MLSNCLIESLKAKRRNRKVKLLFTPAKFSENKPHCFHVMWTDGENEYDFGSDGWVKWFKLPLHEGHIRKFEIGTYNRYINSKGGQYHAK